jgi:hypothetical protein
VVWDLRGDFVPGDVGAARDGVEEHLILVRRPRALDLWGASGCGNHGPIREEPKVGLGEGKFGDRRDPKRSGIVRHVESQRPIQIHSRCSETLWPARPLHRKAPSCTKRFLNRRFMV